MSNQLATSYIKHVDSDQWFFVSTINRMSSADMWYSETMAWQFSNETRLRGFLVAKEEGAKDSLYAHCEVCEELSKHGKVRIW